MTISQSKLINSYTTLVLAKRRTIEQVPETVVVVEIKDEEGNVTSTVISTIRSEVEIKVAEKTIEILG